MVERFKALVLKTIVLCGTVGSNPTLSFYLLLLIMLTANIKFWSSCPKSLSKYTSWIEKTFQEFEIVYSRVNLPKRKQRVTLLKSPHVNKKAKEQFEIRIHKVVFFIRRQQFNSSIITQGLLNRPFNVDMSVKVLEG